MIKKLTVIGGDLRIVKLVEMLSADGYQINTFALEKAESLKRINSIILSETLEDAINFSDIVIGSIPLSSNNKQVNTPFSDKTIFVDELIEKLEGKIFIAGSINEETYKIAKTKKVKIIDLLDREELAVLNTISTAEGTIQIAIEETPRTLHGSKVLIAGFGRIGKILAKMLDGIGAQVYCEARKESDLAWIKAYGYKPININELDEKLDNFDIIINTIPHIIFNKRNLEFVRKDCLIIDLASKPGGVDKEAIKEKGIKMIWALALPGKVAPITSAEFIKETIYNILKEINL